MAPGATELESLSRLSEIVPDSLALEAPSSRKLKAATVSSSTLRAVLASESLAFRPYENAIMAALSYDRCRSLPSAGERAACALDKALANVGAILAGMVEGRVATEVDPRLATDTGALVGQVSKLLELYRELGVGKDRLIFRLPATWEGTQAAKKLEADGIATQLFLCYSLVQGVAAMQAGVSVLQPNMGRVREWYNQHPGVIRDPKGPREDSGAVSATDPGLALVKQLYCYARKFHPKARIMVSGVRTREDALSLSGVDYLILNGRVLSQLEAVASDQGYNDGLSAVGGSCGLEPALSLQMAQQESDVVQFEPISEAAWRASLGVAAAELLRVGLSQQAAEVQELVAEMARRAGGTE